MGGGEAGPCLTSLHWPGLIRLEYDDEPLLPQVERWHLVAVTPLQDPAWLLVMWSAVTSVQYCFVTHNDDLQVRHQPRPRL